MEELRGKDIMTLGLDIGIDKSGKQFYLFEVNDSPSSKALKSDVAYFRSNYYLYVLREKLKYNIKDPVGEIESNRDRISQLEKKVTQKDKEIACKEKEVIQKEKEIAQKEKQINDILNSASWKIAGFLRKEKKVIAKK